MGDVEVRMGYRLITGFLGVCFLGIGLVFTVAIPSMASDGDVIALVALPVALLFAVLGINT